MLLSAPSARAGHWEFTCTGSGKVTTTYSQYGIDRGQPSPTVYNWAAPTAPQTGSFNLGSTIGGGSDYAVSAVANADVTVTATWKPDSASDPAPPEVWLCESSQVDWSYGHSGMLQDGFGDPAVANQNNSGQTASTSPGTSIPPAHWTKVSVSGGTAKLPKRTLSAEADSPVSASSPNGDLCVAHIDNDSVTIHATPYNFRRQNFDGESTSVHVDNGLLTFHYVWSSTSGSLGDLSGETIHENVACSVQTDNPPFLWQPPALTDISVRAEASHGLDDINSYGTYPGELVQDAFAKPYKVDHFTLTQSFLFNDPAIMTTSDRQPIPLTVGPYTILDAVVADAGSPSGYSFVVTKDSVPSDPINLP